jgi:hypothetical protein
VPSPFPGMDPFIEGQRWRDFHATFITLIREMLTPQVRPRYVVEIEEYVYLAREGEAPDRVIVPDVSVIESRADAAAGVQASGRTTALMEPVVHTLPVPEQYRQTYLTVRNREWQDVVTVIELLSPVNKAPGDGQKEYLAKRNNVFHAPAHLVELDLLRRGERLPTLEPLEPADFYAFVCRTQRFPKVDVYAWTVRQRLPVIPIPLAEGDPDVPLDLQAAFTTTYDRAGYDYAVDYRRPSDPPLDPATAEWARSLLPK